VAQLTGAPWKIDIMQEGAIIHRKAPCFLSGLLALLSCGKKPELISTPLWFVFLLEQVRAGSEQGGDQAGEMKLSLVLVAI